MSAGLRGLKQFDPQLAASLLEFAHELAETDTDYVVFVARKALCLFDILAECGAQLPRAVVLSDRVLDLDLKPFRGKRVLLVDDTLILGTTLAKLRKRLVDSGAEVRTKVFCIDQDWWARDIFEPDSYAHLLSNAGVMAFCAAEVRAFGLVPRPYHTDFPRAAPISLELSGLDALLGQLDWDVHAIGSTQQANQDIHVYTFLPTPGILADLDARIGGISNVVDIAKVRAFVRISHSVAEVQFIPMVTLKPLRRDTLQELIVELGGHVRRATGEDFSRLCDAADQSPRAQQRIVQFYLSLVLLDIFRNTTGRQPVHDLDILLDHHDAARHFGPWFASQLTGLDKASRTAHTTTRSFVPAALPKAAERGASELIREALAGQTHEGTGGEVHADNLLARFSEVFLHLYHKREIPARIAAKMKGREWVEGVDGDNRLEIGLPWKTLLESVTAGSSSPGAYELSLVLDRCVDLGIAVPVTCVSEGVVYRGYRHGEDVRFTDSELGLAYEAVRGFLAATGRQAMTRLSLEKLLVLLLRVGVETRFLEPLYGSTGEDGLVRTRFHLHGAVAKRAFHSNARGDREVWLSSYLVQRKVLREVREGYALGFKREGNYVVPDAENRAFQFGNVLGSLWTAPDGGRKGAILSDESMILLASCSTPRDTAAALLAELDIARESYLEDVAPTLVRADWTVSGVQSARNVLHGSRAFTAVHQAHLKAIGYAKGEAGEIVRRCEEHLARQPGGGLAASVWAGSWQHLADHEFANEKKRFDQGITEIATLLWEMEAGFSVLKIAFALAELKAGAGTQAQLDGEIDAFQSRAQAMAIANYRRPPSIIRLQGELRRHRANQFADPDPKGLATLATSFINSRLAPAWNTSSIIDRLLEQTAVNPSQTSYTYVLIYDIVDSTGTKAAERGVDLNGYRARVAGWKADINQRLRQLSRELRHRGGTIAFCRGDLDSLDDEKHIFIAGPHALHELKTTLAIVLGTCFAYPDVRLRIQIAPCNFSGGGAYRAPTETEVHGASFWEHLSRLRPQIKAAYEPTRGDRSTLAIVTSALRQTFTLPDQVHSSHPVDQNFKTHIAGMYLPTSVTSMAVEIRLGEPRRIPIRDDPPDPPPSMQPTNASDLAS